MIEQTTLRDELARERTVLANERTLLAYGRTALGLVGLAVIIFKFTEDPTFAVMVGSLALAAGALIGYFGIRNYRLTNSRIMGDIAAEPSPYIDDVLSIVEAE
jgi:putative membrane protein